MVIKRPFSLFDSEEIIVYWD